jgi:hypothetical protein
MVVRLKADQFTAGDMAFMVRSRRRARADPRFYGENVGKQPAEKKKKEVAEPITATVSDKGEKFKESDEYFNPVVPEEEEEQSLEEQVRVEPVDTLNERARKILKEIEDDMKQINNMKLDKDALKR